MRPPTDAGEPSDGKRRVHLVAISDTHLGTVGCHAKALLAYLRGVDPQILILNGDIIDMWQFSRYYWPKAHMKVVKRLMKMIAAGTEVYYIPGNHDELLRKFTEQHLGNFHLVNKVVLELDGMRAWFFHGDVFDVVSVHSRWLSRLGSAGYDLLILINRFANFISAMFGRGKLSISKRIKDSVKSAAKYIGDFEGTVASIATENGFDFVVCGHIHQPFIKEMVTAKGRVTYLNSGDWIENLTALEYAEGVWSIYRHQEEAGSRAGAEASEPDPEEDAEVDLPASVLGFLRPA
jgi:UDP-2,3-diacylglucosamine pyrophosphatase LpxH